jgi:hypothetical protein
MSYMYAHYANSAQRLTGHMSRSVSGLSERGLGIVTKDQDSAEDSGDTQPDTSRSPLRIPHLVTQRNYLVSPDFAPLRVLGQEILSATTLWLHDSLLLDPPWDEVVKPSLLTLCRLP